MVLKFFDNRNKQKINKFIRTGRIVFIAASAGMILFSNLTAQTVSEYLAKIDSLKNKIGSSRDINNNCEFYHELCDCYADLYMIDSLKKYASILLSEADHHNLEEEIGWAYFWLAINSRYNYDRKNLFDYLAKANNIFTSLNTSKGIIKTLNLYGEANVLFENVKESKKYFGEALDLSLKINDPRMLMESLSYKAQLYYINGFYSKADSLYEVVRNLSLKHNAVLMITINNARHAYNLVKLNRFDEALNLMRENITRINGLYDSNLLPDTYNDFAYVLLQSGDIEQALSNIKKALEYPEAHKNIQLAQVIYANEVNAHVKLGRFEEAYHSKSKQFEYQQIKIEHINHANLASQISASHILENQKENEFYLILFSSLAGILLIAVIFYIRLHKQKTKHNLELEAQVRNRTEELFGKNKKLKEEIESRIKAEEELKLNEERLSSLFQISQYKAANIQDLLDYALHHAVSLTRSKIGYIYRYDEIKKEFTLNTWSRDVMKECKIIEPQTIYQLEKTGIWGEAVRQRKPILVNDYPDHNPLKKGYPEGHVALKKFLTIPIEREDKIVAVVGVANKETDYGEIDLHLLTLFMDTVWTIVERKTVEEQLKDYLHLNEKLISSSSVGIIAYNFNGQCIFANELAAKALGAKKEYLLRQNFNQIDSWKISGLLRVAENTLSTGEVGHLETEIDTTFGRKIWADCTFSKFELNNLPHLLLTFQDITEKIKSHNRLAESETRFRKLFEDSAGATSLVENNIFIDCNNATLKMMGMDSIDEFRNRSPVDLSPEYQPDGRRSDEKVAEMTALAYEKGSNLFEWVHTKKDGSEFYAEVLLTPIYYSDRKMLHVVWRDISEQKKLLDINQKATERAGRQRSALAKLTLNKNIFGDNTGDAFQIITETAAEACDVERVSIWFFSNDFRKLECNDLFEHKSNRHSNSTVIETADYPRFIDALKSQSRIFAEDAQTDPRTNEFKESYLSPFGIRSMLDAGIFLGGELIGVVCFEHVGAKRRWYPDEEAFASIVSSIISEILIDAETRKAKAATGKLTERLDLATNAANIGIWDWDITRDELHWDKKMYELYGLNYSNTKNVYETWINGVHPDDRKYADESIKLALENIKPYDLIFRVLWPDGSIHFIKGDAKIIWDDSGKPVRMIGTNYDITKQKISEETLKKSEYFLQKSQSVAKVGSYNLDVKTGRWISSKTLDDIFGIDDTYERNIEGWIKFVHPDEKSEMSDYIINYVIKGRNRFDKEYRIVRADNNEVRWMHGLGELEFEANDEIKNMIGTIQDITERKEVEAKIRNSESVLRQVIESSPIAMLVNDKNFNVQYMNKTFAALFGYTTDDVRCINDWWPLAYPDEVYRKKIISEWDRRVETAKRLNAPIVPMEAVVKCKDGSDRIIEFNTSAIGERVLIIFVDITERKNAESMIKESEEKYRLLFENMTTGFALHEILYDEKGNPFDYRYLEINPSFEKLTGVPASALMGKTAKELLPAGEEYWLSRAEYVAQTGESVNFENYSHYAGKYFSTFMFCPKKGRLAVVFYDITDARIASEKISAINDELHELILTKDKFFSIIAHDLRNPMNALMGISQILKEEFDEMPKEEAAKLIDSVHETSFSTYRLLENLLSWSRIQTGRMTFTKEKINLYTAVHHAVKPLLESASQKSVIIKTDVDPNISINADLNMLELILRNLVSNALKFSYNNSQIEISAQRVSDNLHITVKDYGTGIKEEIINDLFKIDKNITSYGTNNEKGTGLGLQLCMEMAKRHSGTIDVESSLGKGSKFTVVLPD